MHTGRGGWVRWVQQTLEPLDMRMFYGPTPPPACAQQSTSMWFPKSALECPSQQHSWSQKGKRPRCHWPQKAREGVVPSQDGILCSRGRGSATACTNMDGPHLPVLGEEARQHTESHPELLEVCPGSLWAVSFSAHADVAHCGNPSSFPCMVTAFCLSTPLGQVSQVTLMG